MAFVCLFPWASGRTILPSAGCGPYRPGSFPHLLCPSELLLWDPSCLLPGQEAGCSPDAPRLGSVILLPPLMIDTFSISCSPWPRLTQITSLPPQQGQQVPQWPNQALPRSCLKSLQDCMCPAVLPFQQMTGRFTEPRSARLCHLPTFSTGLKKASSTPHPDPESSNMPPTHCLPPCPPVGSDPRPLTRTLSMSQDSSAHPS